jgi:hypothetical protein
VCFALKPGGSRLSLTLVLTDQPEPPRGAYWPSVVGRSQPIRQRDGADCYPLAVSKPAPAAKDYTVWVFHGTDVLSSQRFHAVAAPPPSLPPLALPSPIPTGAVAGARRDNPIATAPPADVTPDAVPAAPRGPIQFHYHPRGRSTSIRRPHRRPLPHRPRRQPRRPRPIVRLRPPLRRGRSCPRQPRSSRPHPPTYRLRRRRPRRRLRLRALRRPWCRVWRARRPRRSCQPFPSPIRRRPQSHYHHRIRPPLPPPPRLPILRRPSRRRRHRCRRRGPRRQHRPAE